jgi:hypothetical protein
MALTASLTVVLAAVLGLSASTGREPRLTVVARAPLVVAGAGFDARVRITVDALAAAVRERRVVVTDARGRFRAPFHRVRLTGRHRCGIGVVIIARAPGGTPVLWRPDGMPDCTEPLRPPAATR